MLDTILLMTLAAMAWIGWLKGMMTPRAQFWVKFVGPFGLCWLTWYFFHCLTRSQPALIAGGLEAGHWTVVFMVGGVWALLARPRPSPPENLSDDTRIA